MWTYKACCQVEKQHAEGCSKEARHARRNTLCTRGWLCIHTGSLKATGLYVDHLTTPLCVRTSRHHTQLAVCTLLQTMCSLGCRCADVFIGHCLPFLLALAKAQPALLSPALEACQALQELFTSNLKLGLPSARQAAKQLLVLLYQQGSSASKQALIGLIKERVLYCVHHHRSLDVASSMQQELGLLTQLVTGVPTPDAQAWQAQMLLLFQLLLPATGESLLALLCFHQSSCVSSDRHAWRCCFGLEV